MHFLVHIQVCYLTGFPLAKVDLQRMLHYFNPLPDWSKLKQIAEVILKCMKNGK